MPLLFKANAANIHSTINLTFLFLYFHKLIVFVVDSVAPPTTSARYNYYSVTCNCAFVFNHGG